VAADAVIVEPVSTPQFPANRELPLICPLRAIVEADTRVNSRVFGRIPYATEQGITSAEQGILVQEQGILPATRFSPPDEIFGTHLS
jgi:hypothetical protein